MAMRLPCRSFQSAMDYARHKADETGRTWYVNRLASSGMQYEASDVAITDTSFGGGVVETIKPLRACIRCGAPFVAVALGIEPGKAFAHRYCQKCRASLPITDVITEVR